MLYIGCALLIFIGLVHSYLGEKYLLIRLFRRDNLPHLMGGDWFTMRVLRFAWHITTIAWWGFAAILYLYATPTLKTMNHVLTVIGVVFLLSGIVSFAFSRARHLSWLFFWAIAGICLYASYDSLIK